MIQEGKGNYIDDYFKDRLYNYETSAPEDMWIKIDDQIKKKKSIALWTWISSFAASIIIILSVGIGYYFGSRHNINSNKNKVVSASRSTEKSNKISGNFPKDAAQKNPQSVYLNSEVGKNVINKSTNTYIYSSSINSTKEVSGNKFMIADTIVKRNSSSQIYSLNNIKSRQPFLPNNYNKQKLAISERNIDMMLGLESPSLQPIIVESKQSWALSGKVAPLYLAWKVDNNNDQLPESYIGSVEKPNIAYTGGLNINFETSRWRFESGIYYSHSNQNLDEFSNTLAVRKVDNSNVDFLMTESPNGNAAYIGKIWIKNSHSISLEIVSKYQNNYTSIYYGSKNTPYIIYSANSTNDSSNLINSSAQISNFIEIPFLAEYKIIDSKLDVFVSGGISANILLSSNGYIKLTNDILNLGPTNIKTFNYSGILGLTFEMAIVKKVSFRFEPRLSYTINSIDKISTIGVHPYSFGAFSGISYHF